MNLVQKDSEAPINTSFEQLQAILKWKTEADFDLAAIYQSENDTKGMVYFGNLGNLGVAPFMKLSGDAGVGDTVDGEDGNEEIMTISKFKGVKKIWILCWDYGAVQKGEHARFSDSDVTLTLTDNKDQNHQVNLDTGEFGNVTCVASIEISPDGAKLINTSSVGTLKGLSKLEDVTQALSIH